MNKCKKHPKYKALRQPIADCNCCWRMWEQAQKRRRQEIETTVAASP